MSAYYAYLNDLINRSIKKYRDSGTINWANPYTSQEFEDQKADILKSYSKAVNWSFKKTKPWVNSISKGCELCGQGDWSCLFITGRCNANCFYCPTAQNNDDLPTAQQLSFDDPEVYANFLNDFNFKGCSFSGGEPFLVFDKMMNFLEVIRKRTSPDMYIWMYTNGLLASKEKFQLLADKGLNEVRFDIGATAYKTDFIDHASGIIKHITVEIPAVPDKKDLLIKLIPELIEKGVTNINLHQMRLTTFNAPELLKRDYTYVHGEHPVVLESELAALEILRYVDENNLAIGINYCGFQYKQRFQKAGYRKKIAEKLYPNSQISENGFLCKFFKDSETNGKNAALTNQEIVAKMQTGELSEMNLNEVMTINSNTPFVLVSFEGMLLEPGSPTNGDTARIIDQSTYHVDQASVAAPLIFKAESIAALQTLLSSDGANIPEDPDLFAVWKYYFIEYGFRDYS